MSTKQSDTQYGSEQKILNALKDNDLDSLTPHEKRVIKRLAKIARIEVPLLESQKGLNDLKQRIAARSSLRRSLRLRKRLATAAAVIALLLIGTWLVYYAYDIATLTDDTTLVAQDKGGERGVSDSTVLLTLPNGTILSLADEYASADIPDTADAHQETLTPAYSIVDVPRGRDLRLTLSDGTRLVINSESRVHFPREFMGEQRRVLLEYGEAFFEVTKDADHPFIVEVQGREVEVLGTSFCISAYPEESLSTTLVTGSIAYNKEETREILKPGQQLVDQGTTTSIRYVDVEEYISWTQGVFLFDNLELGTIMTKLGRRYDFEVIYTSPELARYTFTGMIDYSFTLEYLCTLLQQTTDLKIELTSDRKVYITR